MLIKEKNCWSEPEKTIAQSINFKSPQAYTYLKESLGFHLPCKSSLNNWIPLKHLHAGFHAENIRQLKELVKNMDSISKEVVILSDDMAIKTDLKYDSFKDEVTGFLDYGFRRENKLGKHVCTIMIQGLFKKWKHVLSFYVTASGISGKELADLLIENIRKASEIGLSVRAVINDQASNNRSCFKSLNVSKEVPYFEVENRKIYALFDVPHLIKSIRNMHMKYDFQTEDGLASFNILRSMYDIDTQCKSTRMCPKLTEAHIHPNSFEKMSVSRATQVYSHSSAVAIKTMVGLNKFGNMNDVALSTSKFVEKIDKLFDCLNSKYLYHKNPYSCAIQKNNNVHVFLLEMLQYFEKIQPKTNTTIHCIQGMIQTLKAILGLFNDILDEDNDLYFMILNRLNQDSLENLFAQVRAWCGANTNPSAYQFGFILAKILSVKLINNQTDNSNCEEDDGNFILENDLQSGVKMTITDEDEQNIADEIKVSEFIIQANNTISLENKKAIDLNSMRYVCGFVIFKFLKQISCNNCKQIIMKDCNEKLSLRSELFLFHKNYDNQSHLNKLTPPSDLFFEISVDHIKIFDKLFFENCHQKGIKKYILDECINFSNSKEKCEEWFNLSHPCYHHRKHLLDYLILLLIRKNSVWFKQKILKDNIVTKNFKKGENVKRKADPHSPKSKKMKILT